ncbi:MAG: thioredoxin domain-containing protein [Bdellovibrio sp.]
MNKLANSKSLYLLQHKDNPVDWHPWGPEAIEKARSLNRPIFLSIGYSSCHWCHVMAEESFEDEAVAKLLNDNFVCIKVDREEHPNLDSYYQEACQLFIKSGGWPLSAFLLPDLRPYFVGTFYPKVATKSGGPTFPQLVQELGRVYNDEKEQVLSNADQVAKALSEKRRPKEDIPFPGHFPAPMAILDAVKEYRDNENGGWGEAPKFPHFSFMEWAAEQMIDGMVDKEQGQFIIKTLDHLLMGGVFDQARGGIHRYSVDKEFLVPHFEKMLYDQSGLIRVLSKFSLIYPHALVFDALYTTLLYLEKEMLSDNGHLFSAQDADSEGVEGLYYTFTSEEFEDLVNKAEFEGDLDAEQMKKWFRISTQGNFENGLNVLALDPNIKDQFFSQEEWEKIRAIRKAALDERQKRIPPKTDNKGVASWNFLMIASLTDVLQYCRVAPIREVATRILNSIVDGSYINFLVETPDKKRRIRHTTTMTPEVLHLEDYVSFSESMLRLYEISGNPVFKENLRDTIDFILNEFLKGDQLFITSTSLPQDLLPPNLEAQPFDGSFKSSSATFCAVVRRAAVLFKNSQWLEKTKDLRETVAQCALRNPIISGEALRALTYPDMTYRTLEVPLKWQSTPEFQEQMSYFMPRFVISYQDRNEDEWQICNMTACEVQGKGLQEFKDKLMPKQSE